MRWNMGWYYCACTLSGIVLAVFARPHGATFALLALLWVAFACCAYFAKTRLALQGLTLLACAWVYADFRCRQAQADQPSSAAFDRVYLMRAEVADSYASQFGHGLLLKHIEVLRPNNPGFVLKRLRVYAPLFERPPQRGSQIQAWVRLRQRKPTRPIPWPMQTWREAYWPQVFGTIKTLDLVNYVPQEATVSSLLNQGNRELLGALLHNEASQLWSERLGPLGLGHLLAISGLHFGVFFILLQICFACIRMPYLRLVVTLVALIGFGAWMGWTASVLRAFAMLGLWLLLPFLKRKRLRMRLWMGVLLACLIWQPLFLLQRGFWYTFAASGGLMLGYRLRLPTPLEHPWLRRIRPSLPIIAAQMMVTPIHLLFFVEARWDSVLWNLFGFVFLSVIGVQLGLAAVGSFIDPVAALANLSEAFLERALVALQAVPHGSLVRFPYEPELAFVCLLMMLGALAFMAREWRWYVTLLVLAIFLVNGQPKQGARWVMFDVGQGAAMLYVDGTGRGWLFDAGGKLPLGLRLDLLIQLHGVKKLQAVFVSHCNSDHYNLLETVPEDVPVFVPHAQIEAFQALASRNWHGLSKGDIMVEDDFILEVLWPPPESDGADRNETGLVLRVQHDAGSQALLMGDAGKAVEPFIESRTPVDLLQVGHHGSRTATGEDFLRRHKPKLAWISCGYENRFGHPHPETRNALECLGLAYCTTAGVGTLIFRLP